MHKERYYSDVTTCKRCLLFLGYHWKGIFTITWPLLCLPVALATDGTPKWRVAFLIVCMSGFWITECIPLYVTSMIPLFFLPAFGVLSSIKTCEQYFQDTIIMFMSGIMVALLIEYSNLHKRIALLTVKIMGGSPRRIHFGLMLVTGFLSMWISNSAATAMMCPILKGVLESLEKQGVSVYEEDEPEDPKDVNEKRPSKLSIAMYLSICYSSSIGGCGTLIGTPTNLAFYGLYEARFGKLNPTETLDFVTFMGYGIPPVILILLLTYFCIEIFYMGLLSKKNKVNQEIKEVCKDKAAAKAVVNASYKALGPMNCHETSALVLFIVLVILFLSKSPKVFPGWGDLINPNIKNSVPTAFIVALSFLLPRTCNYFRFCCGTKAVPRKEIDSLQTWKNLQTHMPWGLIFLVGGGFALAAGSKQSELDKALSSALKGLGILPHPVILFLCIVFAMIATAFTANVAMCNVIIPVLCEMSLAIRCHPLYLVIPVGIACSMAFHLPVSTPPNAIVASFANISTKSMIVAGIGPSVISIFVLLVFCLGWSRVIYPTIGEFPEWAEEKINTTTVATT